MNEIYTTIAGNVATEPRSVRLADGTLALSLRIASTPRRYIAKSQEWRDGETLFITVRCWRSLAQSVEASVRKGEPVVAHGKLQVASYEVGGVRKTSLEMDAFSIGHDLSRGTATFEKTPRRRAAIDDESRQQALASTADWDEAQGLAGVSGELEQTGEAVGAGIGDDVPVWATGSRNGEGEEKVPWQAGAVAAEEAA